MIDLEFIDTKAALDDLGVEYKESGRNVSSGWLGLQCPFCSDHSTHLGLNLKSNMFSCWACGEHGSIVKLIKEIKEISFHKSELLLKPFERESVLDLPQDKNTTSAILGGRSGGVLKYPSPLLETMPEPHRQYLLSRHFDPDLIAKKYQLKFTYNTGDYRFRIIAPIFRSEKAVSWIAGDVIRKGSSPPYLKCPLEWSPVPANNCLYNLDSVKDVAVLTEGMTDVWRIGDGAVASMTKSINSEQVMELVKKGVKKVFVMYDADAIDRSRIAANKLRGFFSVDVLELDEGDPADLSLQEVISLRADIFRK